MVQDPRDTVFLDISREIFPHFIVGKSKILRAIFFCWKSHNEPCSESKIPTIQLMNMITFDQFFVHIKIEQAKANYMTNAART